MDIKLLTFKANTYNTNYGSGGRGLIDISGVPRVLIMSENFYYNGDTSKEVISTYSLSPLTLIKVMNFGVNELIMQNVINGVGTLPASKDLMKSLIRIKRSSYLQASYITTSYNWLMETPTLDVDALTRASFFSFKDFYGHMILKTTYFSNFIGMSNTATTTSPLWMSFATATSPMKRLASNVPLIYFDPLRTSMKKFECTSNTFTNIKSW